MSNLNRPINGAVGINGTVLTGKVSSVDADTLKFSKWSLGKFVIITKPRKTTEYSLDLDFFLYEDKWATA